MENHRVVVCYTKNKNDEKINMYINVDAYIDYGSDVQRLCG